MKKIWILISFLLIKHSLFAQKEFPKDTIIKNKLEHLLSKYRRITDKKTYLYAQSKSDTILDKINFITDIVNKSYYGGEKGTEVKNDLIYPFSVTKTSISNLIDNSDQSIELSTVNNLDGIDSLLNSLYNFNIKNRYKNITISGDDSLWVDIEVKVYKSFAGKEELSGFKVFCENPFVKNSRMDFGHTKDAKRKMKAGKSRFHIEKGNLYQEGTFSIIFSDPETHIVTFSKEECKIKK